MRFLCIFFSFFFSFPLLYFTVMEDELVQLRDIVIQLRAENERLHQERVAMVSTDSVPALCDNTAAIYQCGN